MRKLDSYFDSNAAIFGGAKQLSRKTKCAASSKLKAAQSVFLYSAEAFAPTSAEACAPTFAEASTSASYKMATPYVHTEAAVFVSRGPLAVSIGLRSAHNKFYPISHPCGCGAFRFFLWWLFLHRRLRSGNEARLSSNYSPPSAGPLQWVPLVFIRVVRVGLATYSS